jgi:hypothetical protein
VHFSLSEVEGAGGRASTPSLQASVANESVKGKGMLAGSMIEASGCCCPLLLLLRETFRPAYHGNSSSLLVGLAI